MSTTRTDLLQNRLGTSHPAVTKADFLKAYFWVNATSGTPILFQSLNVSSVTDTGVGQNQVNYTSAFQGLSTSVSLGSTSHHCYIPANGLTYTQTRTTDAANTAVDTYTSALVAGTLA